MRSVFCLTLIWLLVGNACAQVQEAVDRIVFAYTDLWSFEADARFGCSAQLHGVLAPSTRNAQPGSVASLKAVKAILDHTKNVLAMWCATSPTLDATVPIEGGETLKATHKADGSVAFEARTPEAQRLIKAHDDALAYERYRGHRAVTVVNPGGWGSSLENMTDEALAYRHMVIQSQLKLTGSCGRESRTAIVRFAEEAARLAKAGKFDFALTYAKLALPALSYAGAGRPFGPSNGPGGACAVRLSASELRSIAEQYIVPMLTDMALWAARAGRLDESQQAMTLLRMFRLALLEEATLPLDEANDAFVFAPYETGMAEAFGLRGRTQQMPGGAEDLVARQAERAKTAPRNSIDPKLATATTADAQRNRDDLRWLAQAGHRAVLLRYHVAPGGVFAIVVLPDGREQIFHLSASRSELWRTIHQMRALLDPAVGDANAQANLGELRALAKQLDDWLVAPVAKVVDGANPHSVLISAPDVLAYLPWSALYDGRRWLIERWPLAYFDVAATATVRRAPVTPDRIATFASVGGHVVDGKRLAAIPKTAEEVRRIRELLGESVGVFENAQFNWRSFSNSVSEGRFNGIHIASHFVIRPDNPSLSYFLLGDGKTMPLAALQQLDFTGAELVYLSACQTAMDTLSSRSGDEVTSALIAFIKRGASSAIGTLQAVDDEATALLTRQFYSNLAQHRGSIAKSDALRAAQLALLRGDVLGSGRGVFNRERPLSHPMYWSQFMIVGNWR